MDKIENKANLVMGLVPCLNNYFISIVWPVVKPYIEKLAQKSNGEYDIYRIWKDIYYGNVHLYVAYYSEEEVKPENYQEKIVHFLQTPDKNFVGYAIVRFEATHAHIWQAYITEKYQNTTALSTAFNYIENTVKDIGAPYISFSTMREGWHGMSAKLGFTETYTVYRKEIK